MTGKIISFKPERGYGFLTPDGSKTDLFFYRNALPEQHQHTRLEDEPCEFDLVEGKKGPAAVNIRLLSDGTSKVSGGAL